MLAARPLADRAPAPAPAPLARLVGAARAGDDAAWSQLVTRFERLLRRIARQYGLRPADVDDAVQLTWLRLHSRLDTLREPAALPGWLATTMRRECLRALQSGVEVVLLDDLAAFEGADERDPCTLVLAAEQRRDLAAALAVLPARHRTLMELLLAEPELGYRAIAARTGMPVGSIGPIRRRCLERLAQHPALGA